MTEKAEEQKMTEKTEECKKPEEKDVKGVEGWVK